MTGVGLPLSPDPGRATRRLDPNRGWLLPGLEPPVTDEPPGQRPLPVSAMVRASVVLVRGPGSGPPRPADWFEALLADVLSELGESDEVVVVDARGVVEPPALQQRVLGPAVGAAGPATESDDAGTRGERADTARADDSGGDGPGDAPSDDDLPDDAPSGDAPSGDDRVRRVVTASARPWAWAADLGILHVRGRILVVPESLAHAAAVASSADGLVTRGVLASEVRSARSDHPSVRAVGLVGWRDAMLGRVGFLDEAAADPWADWQARLAAALVPAARSRVVVDDAWSAEDAPTDEDMSTGVESEMAGDPPAGERPDRTEPGPSNDDAGRVLFPRLREPVSVTLASIPARREHLHRVVSTLLPQADLLGVHLNGYPDVPPFLDHPRVLVSRSQDLGDLRDNGKAAFTEAVPDGHHLLVDDDIDYPDDYVRRLVAKVEQFDRRAIVGYHGVVLDLPVRRYFGQRDVHHFGTELGEDRRVHVLGTGTVAMHTSTLRLGLADLPTTGMVDIWLAVAAHRRGIPLVAVARPTRHLHQLEKLGGTLFAEFREDDQAHVEALRTVELPVLA